MPNGKTLEQQIEKGKNGKELTADEQIKTYRSIDNILFILYLFMYLNIYIV